MEQREFCDRALAQVRHATPEEKDAIRAELLGHMEDHAAALTAAGCDEGTAQSRAAEAMGNPEEVGRELNRQYPLFWLVLSRAALILTIFTAIALAGRLPLLAYAFDNIQARTEAEPYPLENLRGNIRYPVDARAEVGNDVLRVFGVGLETFDGRETGTVSIAMCNYDRNIFGQASHSLLQRVTFEADGEEIRSYGGGGSSNSGVSVWVAREVEVSRRAETIAVCYDAFGMTARIEVPLNWEGAE